MSKKTYTPTYSAEFRERAIQLFKDHRAEYTSDNKAYRGIAEKLGCSGDSLHTWCLQAARDAGQRIQKKARADETTRRLMSIPGIGSICAVAIEALAPPAESFTKGRDFAAWIGLTPRQNSSGGKVRIGKTSKMGQRDLRRLLIIGAMAVVRATDRKGAPAGSPRRRRKAKTAPEHGF